METNSFKSGSAYSTTSSMIRGIQTGDEYQWNRFCGLYSSLIRYWCGRGKGQFSESDIDELTQRVLIKVHKSIEKFDLHRPNRVFRAWLREITNNVICDFLREEKRRRKTVTMADRSSLIGNAIQVESPEPNEDDEKPILMHRILELVHPEFNEKHWEVFFLFINAGLTSTEVASAMNMKPDNVRKIKNRIFKRLREACREFGLEELFMNMNGD